MESLRRRACGLLEGQFLGVTRVSPWLERPFKSIFKLEPRRRAALTSSRCRSGKSCPSALAISSRLVQDQRGKTPLTAAAEANQLEVTRCLLDAHADANAVDKEGLTPLLWTTSNGHLQVMRLLIEAKAFKDASNERLETPLFLVATSGYATAVRVLTDAGADKERADENGYTPLPLSSFSWRNAWETRHVAAENGHLEAVHVLLEAGARINASATSGATPLFLSAKRGHLKAGGTSIDGV